MEWIKVEHVTPDKPEISLLAEILQIDQDAAFGKVLRFWIWVDQQAEDSDVLSVTETLLDRITFCTGFAKALVEVGWLKRKKGGFSIPNFDRHCSNTAKSRALTRDRMKRKRDATNVTKALPEGEVEVEVDVQPVLSTSEEEEVPSQMGPPSLPPVSGTKDQEAWALIGRLEKELSMPMHAMGHHAGILERQWRKKFNDDQIVDAAVQAGEWLRTMSGNKMDGLFGILKRYDPDKERPWKNRCPECGNKGFYDRGMWTRPAGKGTQLKTKCVKCNHLGPVSAQIEREIKEKSSNPRGAFKPERMFG